LDKSLLEASIVGAAGIPAVASLHCRDHTPA